MLFKQFNQKSQWNRPLPTFAFYSYILLVLYCFKLTTGAKTTENVRVKVYKGPKECTDENKVQPEKIVAIHYTATIDPSSIAGKAGQKIDSSRDKGIAQAVTVGRGKVIKGLDIGLQGLCKGAYATLIIPPRLAYGDNAHGPLPGKATVRYDLEIIDVRPEPPNEFAKIDTNRDGNLSKKEAKTYFDSMEQPVDIEALWKGEDKDHDGLVSWEEFTGSKGDGPPQQDEEQHRELTDGEQKDFDQVVSVFKQVDTDGDLLVTKKEMSVFFKAAGQKMTTDEIWKIMDLDSDGKINWDEFLQMHFYEQQQIQQKQEDQLWQQKQNKEEIQQNTAVFNRLDTDKDGKLKREELSQLITEAGLELTDQFWNESDFDGDGYISLHEFLGPSHNNEELKDEL